MFTKILVLAALLATPAGAAYIPAQPTLTVGGKVFTDLTNLVVVTCYATTGQQATCRKTPYTAGYTPSGANKFHIYAVKVSTNASTAIQICVGYADNDIGVDSASALTNPVYWGGTSSACRIFAKTSDVTYQEQAIDFTVVNGKYPFMVNNGANSQHADYYGYEEP